MGSPRRPRGKREFLLARTVTGGCRPEFCQRCFELDAIVLCSLPGRNQMMLKLQSFSRLNSAIKNTRLPFRTVTLFSSENIVTVRNGSQKELLNCQCQCLSTSPQTTERRSFSVYSAYKASKLLNLFQSLSSKKWQFREISTTNNLPIIYLFTKDGCTLCDKAKEALQPHMHRFILKEVDITLPENEKWYEMYKYDIPVFHIYEEFLFKHRVDFDTLERGLEKYKDGYKSSK